MTSPFQPGPNPSANPRGSAAAIWISDIVQAVDESLKMTRCDKHIEGGCMSTRARCLTHDLWDGLGQHIYDYLHSISLADVVNKRVTSASRKFDELFPERPAPTSAH